MPSRLAIIIPYRDRAEHLGRLLPHLVDWFAAGGDPLPRIWVSQQADGLPFNRGGLLNAAFVAAETEADTFCFHDVDFLPLEADYSPPEVPTRIIWWGIHERPLRPARPGLSIRAGRVGLGTVTLFLGSHFRRVNGYSNRYFGWGFEDSDLYERCLLKRLRTGQRDGRFLPLDHDNAGFTDHGDKSKAWLENERRFEEQRAEYLASGEIPHGLSDFSARVEPGEPMTVHGPYTNVRAEVSRLLVRFDGAQDPT